MTLAGNETLERSTITLNHLSARQAVAAIRQGEINSEELVSSCLKAIELTDPKIEAWAFLDPDYALAQAREADLQRRSGMPLGPLHGLPIGIKDIFDTKDMPTEDGTPLHRGRTPAYDAAPVERLREAGAVIMGKTVTTELAVYSPGKTHNPHDPQRTPGGSSSGSAAAVAAGMVPLAIGSQTNGSVIHPASYCGVIGYKPSHGLISRYRVLPLSRWLDHIGVFSRSVEDAALLAQQMMGFDERDPETHPLPRQDLLSVALQEPPMPPRLAFIKSSTWDQAGADVAEGFAELTAFLADRVDEIELPEPFANVHAWHRVIMETDLANNLNREFKRGGLGLSQVLKEMIGRGRETLALDYNRALEMMPVLNAVLSKIMLDYDAIITPATSGEAPLGLASTGSPAFCTLWSFCGVPAISLPLLQGSNNMPIGVQMVAAKGDDARLLRTARWLMAYVSRFDEVRGEGEHITVEIGTTPTRSSTRKLWRGWLQKNSCR
jgi:Asp-tRNA(Asn)/Glu-tRNA(Gln) amidotransferase A subunit family amidase